MHRGRDPDRSRRGSLRTDGESGGPAMWRGQTGAPDVFALPSTDPFNDDLQLPYEPQQRDSCHSIVSQPWPVPRDRDRCLDVLGYTS